MNKDSLKKTFVGTRQYFPSLTDDYNGVKVTLLDNSAGSQVPRFVIDRVNDFYKNRNAQKGTVFTRMEQMQQTILDGRQLAAELIGANDHTEIAFGQNATNLFRLFAHHLARDLKAGDHIVITESDHRANVDPWVELAERGIHVHMWHVDDHGNLDYEHYKKLLSLSPKIVAACWTSNATGTIHDIKRITSMAHEAGALVVADGVQQVSHMPTDVKEAGFDFAAFSTYKIFGPHMGFCYINRDHLERLDGYKIQKMVENDCYLFEIGTQNHEGIEAFIGSMEYLSQVASDAANNGLPYEAVPFSIHANTKRKELFSAMYWAKEYEKDLSLHFLKQLQLLSDVELYGKQSALDIEFRAPVFSFNIENWVAEDLGEKLNSYGIEARTGNYFAINLMNRLAHRFHGSALRISMIHYNTTAEIDYFFECLNKVLLKKNL
jgi:cysteine desulfurase family protein (TIGR01976 family)